jgi:putative ABC transport system permease protein
MSWISRLGNVFRKDQLDREVDEELRFHAEQRAADLGLSADEARRRIGNILRLREESRDVRLATWLETLLQDIRIALRLWRKRPLVALTAILTIALGAGMNVAVFQVIWSVMLKPLPYPDPDRLVQVWVDNTKNDRSAPPNALVDRWRESSRAFSHIASYRAWRVTVASGGEPEQVFTGLVSPEFFSTLGAALLAGRAFLPEEAKPGADNAVLLRESYWRRRFAANPAILGADIIVDGMPCRVTGIVPDSFFGAVISQVRIRDGLGRSANAEPDVYLPISRSRVAGMRLGLRSTFVIGRLQPWATVPQAEQELASIAAPGEGGRVWLSPLEQEVGHKLRPALIALMAATACVLFIACANLANLLMAQAVMRRREFAVRAALGAGRVRLIRQLITEALLVSVAGGAAGLLSAQALSRIIVGLYPDAIPRAGESGSTGVVLAFALATTILSGLLFGALPAWRASGESAEGALRVGNLWMNRGSRRWADLMVALQVGLTTVVLIAAGLLLKSFLVLRDVDTGIAREQIVTASVDLPEARFKTREDRGRFGAQWVERLKAIPGVSAAGISNSLPLRYTTLLDVLVHVPGHSGEQLVGGRAVGGAYFEAMGMRWAAGGSFDERRRDQVVINEAFVRKFFEGRPIVGTPLGAGKQPTIITGVVKDVRHLGLREPAQPELFMPFAIFPLNPVDTVVRSILPPDQIAAAMRRELRAIDDQLALGRVMTMNDVVGDQLARPRFQAVLLGLFAVVAIALAAVGTYGVIAHSVRSRVAEFGLRRALGAETLDLLRLVLSEGLKAPLLGLAVGLLVGAFAVGRYLETLLFGIAPRDPGVLLLTACSLALTALLACALPGRAATRIEPGQALRLE